jgi:hypothetical protein
MRTPTEIAATKSEQNAIRLFTQLGAEVSSIPTESKERRRTPDYVVAAGKVELIVEVKEIVENEVELGQLKMIERGETVSVDHSLDTRRFAACIRDGNRQLKRMCIGRPGMTLIQDVRSFLFKASSSQQTLSEAMFGIQTIWRTVPPIGRSVRSITTAHVFGGNRSVTVNHNKTTSAVGLLIENSSDELQLLLHHNPHAAAPLPRGLFASPQYREFEIASHSNFGSFIEIVAR